MAKYRRERGIPDAVADSTLAQREYANVNAYRMSLGQEPLSWDRFAEKANEHWGGGDVPASIAEMGAERAEASANIPETPASRAALLEVVGGGEPSGRAPSGNPSNHEILEELARRMVSEAGWDNLLARWGGAALSGGLPGVFAEDVALPVIQKAKGLGKRTLDTPAGNIPGLKQIAQGSEAVHGFVGRGLGAAGRGLETAGKTAGGAFLGAGMSVAGKVSEVTEDITGETPAGLIADVYKGEEERIAAQDEHGGMTAAFEENELFKRVGADKIAGGHVRAVAAAAPLHIGKNAFEFMYHGNRAISSAVAGDPADVVMAEWYGEGVGTDSELYSRAVDNMSERSPVLRELIDFAPFGDDPDDMNTLWRLLTTWGGIDKESAGQPFESAARTALFFADPLAVAGTISSTYRTIKAGRAAFLQGMRNATTRGGSVGLEAASELVSFSGKGFQDPSILLKHGESFGVPAAEVTKLQDFVPKFQAAMEKQTKIRNLVELLNADEMAAQARSHGAPMTEKNLHLLVNSTNEASESLKSAEQIKEALNKLPDDVIDRVIEPAVKALRVEMPELFDDAGAMLPEALEQIETTSRMLYGKAGQHLAANNPQLVSTVRYLEDPQPVGRGPVAQEAESARDPFGGETLTPEEAAARIEDDANLPWEPGGVAKSTDDAGPLPKTSIEDADLNIRHRGFPEDDPRIKAQIEEAEGRAALAEHEAATPDTPSPGIDDATRKAFLEGEQAAKDPIFGQDPADINRPDYVPPPATEETAAREFTPSVSDDARRAFLENTKTPKLTEEALAQLDNEATAIIKNTGADEHAVGSMGWMKAKNDALRTAKEITPFHRRDVVVQKVEEFFKVPEAPPSVAPPAAASAAGVPAPAAPKAPVVEPPPSAPAPDLPKWRRTPRGPVNQRTATHEAIGYGIPMGELSEFMDEKKYARAWTYLEKKLMTEGMSVAEFRTLVQGQTGGADEYWMVLDKIGEGIENLMAGKPFLSKPLEKIAPIAVDANSWTLPTLVVSKSTRGRTVTAQLEKELVEEIFNGEVDNVVIGKSAIRKGKQAWGFKSIQMKAAVPGEKLPPPKLGKDAIGIAKSLGLTIKETKKGVTIEQAARTFEGDKAIGVTQRRAQRAEKAASAAPGSADPGLGLPTSGTPSRRAAATTFKNDVATNMGPETIVSPEEVVAKVKAGELGGLSEHHYTNLDESGAVSPRDVSSLPYSGGAPVKNMLKDKRFFVGNSTEIRGYDGKGIPSHWVLAKNIDDVTPSHTPSMDANSKFPSPGQPRDMSTGDIRSKNTQRGKPENFNENVLLDMGEWTQQGPPNVFSNGMIANGNNRWVILKILQENGGYKKYSDALMGRLKNYGIDIESDAVKKFLKGSDNPVLFRVIDDVPQTWGEQWDLVRELGKDPQQALSATELAIADAKVFEPLLRHLNYGPNDLDISTAINRADNQLDVADAMAAHPESNGFIDEWINERGKKQYALSPNGEQRMAGAAMANLFSDTELLKRASEHEVLMKGLLRGYKHLMGIREAVASKTISDSFLIEPGLRSAVELLAWSKRAGQHPSRYFLQERMPGIGEIIGLEQANPDFMRNTILAEFFITYRNRPKQLSDALERMGKNVSGEIAPVMDLSGRSVMATPQGIATEILNTEFPKIESRGIGADLQSLLLKDSGDVFNNKKIGNESLGEMNQRAFAPSPEDATPKGSGPGGQVTAQDAIAYVNTKKGIADADGAMMRGPSPDDTMGDLYKNPAGKEVIEADLAASQKFVDSAGDDLGKAYLQNDPEYHAQNAGGVGEDDLFRKEHGGPKMLDADDVADEVAGVSSKQADDMAKNIDEMAKGTHPDRAEKAKGTKKGKKTKNGYDDDIVQNSVLGIGRVPIVGSFLNSLRTPYHFLSASGPTGEKIVKAILQAGFVHKDYVKAVGGFVNRLYKGVNVRQGSVEAQYIGMHLDVGHPRYMPAAIKRRDFKAAELENINQKIQEIASKTDIEDPIKELDVLNTAREATKKELAKRQGVVDWGEKYIKLLEETREKLGPARVAELNGVAEQNRRLFVAALRVQHRLSALAAVEEFGNLPLSKLVQRGFPNMIDEATGELLIPSDFLTRMLWDSPDAAKHFKLPMFGNTDYSFDIGRINQSFLTANAKKSFLDPVFEAYYPRGDDLLGAEAQAFKATAPADAKGAVVRQESNPLLKDLGTAEKRYLQTWIDYMQGKKTDLNRLHDDQLLVQARAFAKRSAERLDAGDKTLSEAYGKMSEWAMTEYRTHGAASKITAGLMRMQVRGALGGLQGSFWIKNSLQNFSSLVEAGPIHFIGGLQQFLSKPGFRMVKDLDISREFQDMFTHNPEVVNQLAKIRGQGFDGWKDFAKAGFHVIDTTGKHLMKVPEAIEFWNRGLAFHVNLSKKMAEGGFETTTKAIRKGAWQGLIDDAVENSNRHHFLFGVMGQSPTIRKRPWARMATLFHHYTLNEAELLASWMRPGKHHDMGAFFEYMVWTGYNTALMARAGTDVSDWFGVHGVIMDRYNLSPGSAIPLRSIAQDAVTGLVQWGIGKRFDMPAEAEQGRKKAARSFLITALPGYVGGNRLYNTYKARQDGRMRDNRGTISGAFDGGFRDYFHSITGLRPIERKLKQDAVKQRNVRQQNQTIAIQKKMPGMVESGNIIRDPNAAAGEKQRAREQLKQDREALVAGGAQAETVNRSFKARMADERRGIPPNLSQIIRQKNKRNQNGTVKKEVMTAWESLAKGGYPEKTRELAARQLKKMQEHNRKILLGK